MEHEPNNSEPPILGDLTGAGKVINSAVARKTYDDALSGTFKQLGGLSTDLVKSLRLFTAPLQLAAAYQDRFVDFCQRVRDKVPEAHQQDAAPEIAAPVMEAFTTTSEASPLMTMFEELMAKAIDSREADKLSPEFPAMVRSLSPLEARLLSSLTKDDQFTDDIRDGNKITQNVGSNFDFSDFAGDAHHLTLILALKEKNLVNISVSQIPETEELYPDIQIPEGHKLRRMTTQLSMLGRWFTDACMPKDQPSIRPR